MSQLDTLLEVETSEEKFDSHSTTESLHILQTNGNLAVLSSVDLVTKFEQEQENTQKWITDLQAPIKQVQDKCETDKKNEDEHNELIHKLTPFAQVFGSVGIFLGLKVGNLALAGLATIAAGLYTWEDKTETLHKTATKLIN